LGSLHRSPAEDHRFGHIVGSRRYGITAEPVARLKNRIGVKKSVAAFCQSIRRFSIPGFRCGAHTISA
jgi:hypothetical protein